MWYVFSKNKVQTYHSYLILANIFNTLHEVDFFSCRDLFSLSLTARSLDIIIYPTGGIVFIQVLKFGSNCEWTIYISELLVSPIYATSKQHTFPQRQLLLETNLAFDCVGLFMLLYDFLSSQKLWYSYQLTLSNDGTHSIVPSSSSFSWSFVQIQYYTIPWEHWPKINDFYVVWTQSKSTTL